MARGDHIYVHRDFKGVSYTHHGIDCGDGTVIHYSEEIICRNSIQEFSQGREIRKRQYEDCDSPNLVMVRAESRLGECKYHLIFNNCEHFASWCKTGHKESKQVKPLLDVLDSFLKWRMEDTERQYYQDLIERNNYIIRQLNHQLRDREPIVPVKLQQKAIFTDKTIHNIEECIPQTSQESAIITDKFDYRILQALLQEGCWQEADELTFYAMLKIANRENERYFRPIDISNFPHEHLLIIDKLWRNFSRNLFGFSVQKEIYQSLGGKKDYQYEIWEEFSDRVGWRINDIPLLYEQLYFGLNAPKGHLPHGKRIGSEVVGFLAIV